MAGTGGKSCAFRLIAERAGEAAGADLTDLDEKRPDKTIEIVLSGLFPAPFR
jgi:hypothetical protein